MISDKKLLLKNLYSMMTYVHQGLQESVYAGLDTEEFEDMYDFLAAILSKGIARRVKQGLYQEYIDAHDDLETMCGRLDLRGTIRNTLRHKEFLACEFDDLSQNNMFNQVLKATIIVLLRQETISAGRKVSLKRLLLFFGDIDRIEIANIRWDTFRFKQNNRGYRMLLGICNLVLTGFPISTEVAETEKGFLTEQALNKLCSEFVMGYYKKHYPQLQLGNQFSAKEYQIGVKTIDLSKPFSEITEQLNKAAEQLNAVTL